MDPTILEILEDARRDTKRELTRLTDDIRHRREELETLIGHAAATTNRLDAIEAELGAGAFAEATA